MELGGIGYFVLAPSSYGHFNLLVHSSHDKISGTHKHTFSHLADALGHSACNNVGDTHMSDIIDTVHCP